MDVQSSLLRSSPSCLSVCLCVCLYPLGLCVVFVPPIVAFPLQNASLLDGFFSSPLYPPDLSERTKKTHTLPWLLCSVCCLLALLCLFLLFHLLFLGFFSYSYTPCCHPVHHHHRTAPHRPSIIHHLFFSRFNVHPSNPSTRPSNRLSRLTALYPSIYHPSPLPCVYIWPRAVGGTENGRGPRRFT